ncbi:MAG: histidine triad nucleotide-binding protein [Sphaerobacteraceae bacterium]|nr:MAG: histidine triad nucleotide-binding protein [Sphaerobacteraceae bacterium]
MDECIFCKIAQGDMPADTVYQDERVTAFRDVSPQAKTHVLVIPNVHYDSLNEASADESDLLAHALRICAMVARDEGIDQSGYRVLTNIGDEGGQSVSHLHFHVMGGQELTGKLA